MRKLDLEPAFPAARPRAEDLEDQRRPVNDLAMPAPFQIALLAGAERAVHDDQPGARRRDLIADRLDHSLTDPGRWSDAPAGRRMGDSDIEPDGTRQPGGFL